MAAGPFAATEGRSTQWIAFDVLSATRAPAEEIATLQRQRQRQRLTALPAAAQGTRSCRRVLHGRESQKLPLAALPVTNKAQLMRHFADCRTDPGITLDGLRRFCADRRRIGQPCLGRCASVVSALPLGRSGELRRLVAAPGARARFRV